MDETILLPSPNWFLPSIMAVSNDGWLIYGGPTKSLCVLEPLRADVGVIATTDKYQAHVFFSGNTDKIIAVDISPDWPKQRQFLTGVLDGPVKQWSVDVVNNRVAVKETHCHEIHKTEREDVVGVGYSTEAVAISVGTKNIVKWDLSSNVTKVYDHFLRGVKPTCMACSVHIPLQVAVGTKQGVILVLDLHGKGKVKTKVRGQDDIIMNISWCPQFEITINKSSNVNKSHLDKRLAAIRSEGEKELENETNLLEQSGVGKTLPEDSFDESLVVQEDDTFDIYADHEPDEFGHKKYEPEDILVKVKKEKADDSDYLADCLKLKEEILKRKNQTEPTIESLVDALGNTHVEVGESAQTDLVSSSTESESVQLSTQSTVKCIQISTSNPEKSSHKVLFAAVGKYGGVRIWSDVGKLVASCGIPVPIKPQKATFVTSILWYKPDSLLVIDGRNQLLEINPQHVDSKCKLNWNILHSKHKRGMYCVISNAPRIQTESTVLSEDWGIWSVGQDRNLIHYCGMTKKVLSVNATVGGGVYSVVPCPYDAGKVAVSVGDGAVRVLESGTLPDDETRLTKASVSLYWQNVQGKVLTAAWHPTKENLLAFGTGESRVGLLDVGGKNEPPARTLVPAMSHGVYALCWGEGMQLYASGGNKLVVYQADRISQDPELIDITVEGQQWAICSVSWSTRGLLVGSHGGAIGLLTHRRPHTLIAAAFVCRKMIHSVEWHPDQTSNSTEESPFKNLIVVTSMDREYSIYILEYGTNEKDGTKQLTTWKILTGHTRVVLQTAWNPHRDGLLLSSSQDSTVRVWDVSTGACISIFGGHSCTSLGVCWVAQPQLPHHVLSGGGEFCLRLWDIYQHKSEDYTGSRVVSKKKRRTKPKKQTHGLTEPVVEESTSGEEQDNVAITRDLSDKTLKQPKRFLLPIMYRQINDLHNMLHAPRKMLQMYLQKTEPTGGEKGDGSQNIALEKTETSVDQKGDSTKQEDLPTTVDDDGKDVTESTSTQETVDTNTGTAETAQITEKKTTSKKMKSVNEKGLDYLKIFGSIKEVNEFLDMEMDFHLKGRDESCIMLSIFRGHIDTMIQFASEHNMLCPFLISMAPCVSFKYWKDATQLYLAQIDRLVARSEELKLYENRLYGGPTYRKAAILLSMHDVVGAVAALLAGKLFKEAYILCRIRYMDSVAEEILEKWADAHSFSGQISVAATLHIANGNLSKAAQELAMSHDQDHLRLAADIAKIAGRTTFAYQVEMKADLTQPKITSETTEEILKELPSKIELLMKENTSVNLESDTLDGETLKSDKLNGDSVTNE